MQDETNMQCLALVIHAAQLTEEGLKEAVKSVLALEDGSAAGAIPRGRMGIRELARNGEGLANIEVTDRNIRSFEKHARKHGVAYALKKGGTQENPRYLVVFKARDVWQMKAAFRDYVAEGMAKGGRPSVFSRLKEMAKEAPERPEAARQAREAGQER